MNGQPQGLLQETQAPTAPQQGAPQQGAPEQGTRQATPEQDEQLSLFVDDGLDILASPSMGKTIKKQTGGDAPLEALAKIIVILIGRLETKATKKSPLDPEVVMQAGNVLLGKAIEMYEQNIGQKIGEEERMQAFNFMVSAYIQDAIDTGKISPEELKQLAQELQQTPQGQEIAAQLQAMEGGGQAEPQAPPMQQAPQQAPQQPGLLEGT
jgi:hypothetical protein